MNDSSTTASGAAQPDLRTVVNFLCGNGMLLGRWFFDGPPAGEKDRYWWRNHLRASFAAAERKAYSLDADPDGIRARAADAIMGALAFSAQGADPPPEGHWLTPFWEAAQAEVAARARLAAAGREVGPASDAREPACKACDDTGMAVRCYDGASITHVFDCDQCSRPAPAPASLTQDMESVLIDGVAYQTPAPVAAELLGLHLEVRALTALAAEASDAPPTARKPLTDEQIDGLAVDSDGLPNSHLEFARAIEAAHGIEP
ncbi:hypothetical protein QRO08_09570 [Paracidovorax citrulli]|uniref:Uncharacterized protein n=2 Tax=Paracidovorax citrulli TaxID=80869 RepID=A1TPL5_PARC0|nr:hypothetical protein [Paracidovorax citrulli]ABM32903.1 hypothetical protein Aave_2327 [Paracidovorax citrulli AAC00-1]ATG93129.1 hypothetical protein CQB05_02925 [Paracidovorax citrulli]PVY67120.1 hypothetical protein C8E08_4554 [Paracidovorax citrulli]REG68717.1 hypothetical protein C8E07_1837 [Paracidovorax citrulli]RLJ93272.1 hypothetical protein C8E06_1837 [Paracidovorax citrulli]